MEDVNMKIQTELKRATKTMDGRKPDFVYLGEKQKLHLAEYIKEFLESNDIEMIAVDKRYHLGFGWA